MSGQLTRSIEETQSIQNTTFGLWCSCRFSKILKKLVDVFFKLNTFRKLRIAVISSSYWNVSVFTIFFTYLDKFIVDTWNACPIWANLVGKLWTLRSLANEIFETIINLNPSFMTEMFRTKILGYDPKNLAVKMHNNAT